MISLAGHMFSKYTEACIYCKKDATDAEIDRFLGNPDCTGPRGLN